MPTLLYRYAVFRRLQPSSTPQPSTNSLIIISCSLFRGQCSHKPLSITGERIDCVMMRQIAIHDKVKYYT
jgi:hypothetical protein